MKSTRQFSGPPERGFDAQAALTTAGRTSRGRGCPPHYHGLETEDMSPTSRRPGRSSKHIAVDEQGWFTRSAVGGQHGGEVYRRLDD
jgi:hypothetical protein